MIHVGPYQLVLGLSYCYIIVLQACWLATATHVLKYGSESPGGQFVASYVQNQHLEGV